MINAFSRMTTAEVKAVLGCKDDRTLRKLIKSGRFPKPIRVGREPFWFADTVKDALIKLAGEK